MLKSFLTLVLSLCFLASCAFIGNKSTVPVRFESNPSGANIIIDGVNYGKTPATINVEPKNGVALLSKEGYGSAQINLEVWASIREGGDGTRCLLDAISVLFFFDIYTKYCSDFKKSSYFVEIPYAAPVGAGIGRMKDGQNNSMNPYQNYY